MSDNVINIFPANNFAAVAENAAKEIEVGLVIGYNAEGDMVVLGGGMIDGRQPVCRDWLWLVESFKMKMVNGDYAP